MIPHSIIWCYGITLNKSDIHLLTFSGDSMTLFIKWDQDASLIRLRSLVLIIFICEKLHSTDAVPTGIVGQACAKVFRFGNVVCNRALVTSLCSCDPMSSLGCLVMSCRKLHMYIRYMKLSSNVNISIFCHKKQKICWQEWKIIVCTAILSFYSYSSGDYAGMGSAYQYETSTSLLKDAYKV